MLLAMVRDLRVILVKLADRMHNMRTIEAMAPARRRAIARETLDIYAPIAERLGLYNMKLELEDLGFKALYPHRYQVLERAAQARARQPEGVPEEDRAAAERRASSRAASRRGSRRARSTSTASTSKMRRKRALAQRDRRRLRHPHRCRQPRHLLPRARRRARGVQADAGPLQGLHRDPARQRLPVPAHHAVRPERRADRGADPHRGHAPGRRGRASPRTGSTRPATTRAPCSRSAPASGSRTWCRCRRRAPRRSSSRASRSTCSPTRSTCSPRRARSCACRASATVVDFAYAVHTDIGNRCVAAKVDRRLTPLRTVLRNGQTVRDHHRQGRDPQPVVGQLRRHRQGAHRHPPLPQEPAAHRGHRPRRQLLQQALGEFSIALEDVSAEAQQRRARASSASRTSMSSTRRSAWASAWRRWWRAACCPACRPPAAAGRSSPRSPSPARKGCSSPTRAAASRSRTIRSSPSCPAGRGVVIHRENCVNVEDYRKHPENWLPVTWQPHPGPPVLLRDPRLRRQPHRRARARSPPRSPAPRPTSTTSRSTSRTATPPCSPSSCGCATGATSRAWCASSAACPTSRASSAPSPRTHAASARATMRARPTAASESAARPRNPIRSVARSHR